MKRGEESSCAYSNEGTIGRETRGGEPRDCEAQLRLQKLEEMVTGLMRTTREHPKSHGENMTTHMSIADQCLDDLSPPTSTSFQESCFNSDLSGKTYVSATHWTAILENVSV